MNAILFATHSIKASRNRRMLEFLKSRYCVLLPHRSNGTTLGVNRESVLAISSIGRTAITHNVPVQFDAIDVFAYPLLSRKDCLVDIRCPVPVEIRWLGHKALSLFTESLFRLCIKHARVVTAVNQPMLNYALRFANIKNSFVIPNCPSRKSHVEYPLAVARDSLEIGLSVPTALFISSGRLKEIYGFDLLVRTWKLVHSKVPAARLYVLGSVSELNLTNSQIGQLRKIGIQFIGRVPHNQVSLWISAADVCLSQRTPGFPSMYYNHQDSLKISEYAALRKPIVAAGYLDSHQYISTKTNPMSYCEGILRALRGDAPIPIPRFWEDNRKLLAEAHDTFLEMIHTR